ncbi:hypothetical protein HYX06_04415 [Candidatus Woesearchaeota archaeon]|nr:hypothetical protein [Candidatus Woesearchaeota archaeon]
MPADKYILQRHRELFDHYWRLSGSGQMRESQRSQYYRLAIETGVAMDYMGPTIDGKILLAADAEEILKKVNRAEGFQGQRQVSMNALKGDLKIILRHLQIYGLKRYSPLKSGKI